MYSDLPNNLTKIFAKKLNIQVSELSELNVERYLKEIFSTTTIQTEKKSPDGTIISVRRLLICHYSLYGSRIALLCISRRDTQC